MEGKNNDQKRDVRLTESLTSKRGHESWNSLLSGLLTAAKLPVLSFRDTAVKYISAFRSRLP